MISQIIFFMLLCTCICTCSHIVAFLPQSFFTCYILEITNCPAVPFLTCILARKSFPYYHINLFPECDEMFVFWNSLSWFSYCQSFSTSQSWTLSLHFHFHPNSLPCSESGPVPSVNQIVKTKLPKLHGSGPQNL